MLDRPSEGLNSRVEVMLNWTLPMILENVLAFTSNPEIVETCRVPVLRAKVLILVDAVRVLQVMF
jgi:hypothetical protein